MITAAGPDQPRSATTPERRRKGSGRPGEQVQKLKMHETQARETRTCRLNHDNVSAPASRVSPNKTQRNERSDVETQSAQLVATVFGDHLHAPRGHPHPVDHPPIHQSLERSLGLIFDHISQRAGG